MSARGVLATRLPYRHSILVLPLGLHTPAITASPLGQVQMKTRAHSLRSRTAATAVALLFASSGCNVVDPDPFSIHGTWVGEVSEVEAVLTLVLIPQGDDGVLGLAELTSPTIGTVQGNVSGTLDGDDVYLTVEIQGAIVAGSLVFDGAFDGADNLTGTVDSGLLEGSWPITFQREPV